MITLTIMFPYYNQPKVLERNLSNILNYPKSIREKLHIVVVDDGSMEYPAVDVIERMNLESKLLLRLIRIDIDIPWNQPEANNIGIQSAVTEYIFRTDIDHSFDKENIIKTFNFIEAGLEPSTVYFFERKALINGTLHELSPHVNSYIIRKTDYEKINGYNEYFSGNYGDDIEFRPRLSEAFDLVQIPDIFLIADARGSTNIADKNMKRDITINLQKLEEENLPHYTFTHKDHYIFQKTLSTSIK